MPKNCICIHNTHRIIANEEYTPEQLREIADSMEKDGVLKIKLKINYWNGLECMDFRLENKDEIKNKIEIMRKELKELEDNFSDIN